MRLKICFSAKREFGVTPNLPFIETTAWRLGLSSDTLLAAKEKELIALNNPTFRTFEIKLDKLAGRTLSRKNSVASKFLNEIVAKHFADIG